VITIYTYKKCSTCRNATKWLEARGLEFQERAIRETPPSEQELEVMLKARGGEMRRLFNTSSQDYRDAGLKDRLEGMSEKEAFAILRSNGNLVKRPFLIGDGVAVNGFREKEWEELMG
jgi:arsenate reductase